MNPNPTARRVGTIGFGLALLVGACSSPGAVAVTDAWSRPVPPVSPASAVYFDMTNGLDTPVTLTGAVSDACGEVQLHETTMNDAGVMAMRPLAEGLTVQPGEAAQLAPGGIHLMCMDPEPVEGTFVVRLLLSGSEDVDVTVTIEDR